MKDQFNEKSFYRYKFLSDCLPIYALYTILFREKGMSVSEIALLLSIWSFFTLLLEIPSGVLSDRWNRRNMLFIATFLKAICFILWCFSDTFLGFGLGFLFWGISGAFSSGTEEGLIYDNLKSEGREEAFTEIYGKGRFYATLGILIAIISSGVIANFISISAISIGSAVLCFVNFVFISKLKEKNFYAERLKEEDIGYFKTLFDAGRLCVKRYTILVSMLCLVFIVNIVDYLDEFDALIINDFKLGYIWVSALLTVRMLFIAIGNRIAPIIEEKFKWNGGSFVLSIFASILLLGFSFIWNQYAIPLYGISCMIMTIADVMLVNIIQREIEEEGRSTVMSIYSIAQNIVMIIFSLAYAILTGYYSLNTAYILISIYCLAAGVLVLLVTLLMKRRA